MLFSLTFPLLAQVNFEQTILSSVKIIHMQPGATVNDTPSRHARDRWKRHYQTPTLYQPRIFYASPRPVGSPKIVQARLRAPALTRLP